MGGQNSPMTRPFSFPFFFIVVPIHLQTLKLVAISSYIPIRFQLKSIISTCGR
ncbi:hypothetical protein Hanom_Chr03g00260061 [Helianthus anomalus]